jgi:hypothetical protein
MPPSMFIVSRALAKVCFRKVTKSCDGRRQCFELCVSWWLWACAKLDKICHQQKEQEAHELRPKEGKRESMRASKSPVSRAVLI